MLRPQYSGSRWGQKNYCVQCENLVVFLQMMSELSREIRLILALIYDKITAFKLLGNSYHQAFICKKMQDEILQALSTRGNSNQFGPQYITLDTMDPKILSLNFIQKVYLLDCLLIVNQDFYLKLQFPLLMTAQDSQLCQLMIDCLIQYSREY